ncbi:MAG: holo-[acyl-carrier-protein] synthase [Deltaproteobacteria bacterium]|jgi:holo-[acyl-carrier protein] synthase|nr:holo-[acyl-carrier-protein] synthase [Deltaproteobacteria bacterium]
MIIGIGLDLVEISRIGRLYGRFGRSFAGRILRAEELRELPEAPAAFLAARFAAKEAAVKALGTGFSRGIYFRDIRVCRQEGGKPGLILSGAALERFREMGGTRLHLTLTHSRDNAAAVVIFE